jgi:alcohol dehydrogenase
MQMVPGQEATGVIVELSEAVHKIELGDHMVFLLVPSCSSCQQCVRSRPAFCEPAARPNSAGILLSGERRLRIDGKTLNHHLSDSRYSTYAVAGQKSVVSISRNLPFEEAALFGCALLAEVGAVVSAG